MSTHPVSLDQVFSNAWKSMVRILFKPFSLERWLALGFCCWMITIAADIGTILQFGRGIPSPHSASARQVRTVSNAEIWNKLDQIMNGADGGLLKQVAGQLNISPSLLLTGILIGIGIVICLIALSILLLWLRCRFEFIFLDNLLHNRWEIRKPWGEFRELGNSFFFGSLIFIAAIMAVNLIVLGINGTLVWSWLSECAAAHDFLAFGTPRLITAISLGGAWLLFTLLTGIYYWFFTFLLLQIMYRDRIGFCDGLRRMNVLLLSHSGKCLLFWLMMLIFVFGFGLAVFMGGVLTCCLIWIIVSLPYIRAVALLPFWVFQRFSGVELLLTLDPDAANAEALAITEETGD